MRNRYLLGAGVALAVALSWADAQAQGLIPSLPYGQPVAWYFGGEGGWSNLETAANKVGAIGFRQNFNDGFNVGVRGGIEWGPLRLEEEFRFQQNGVSSISAGAATVATNGNRNAYALMSNAIYDFNLGWA